MSFRIHVWASLWFAGLSWSFAGHAEGRANTAASHREVIVEIPNSRGKAPLVGYLELPTNGRPKATILFLAGSGRGSLDNESRPFNPFRDLFYSAAQMGVASLRFDKRGTGHNANAGLHELQSFSDYVDDAVDAYVYLSSRPDVARGTIVVMGHSLGGVLAIRVAQRFPVAGLILSATPSGLTLDFMREQQGALFNFTLQGQPAAVRPAVKNFLAPYDALVEGSFDFQHCAPERCRKVEGQEVVDDQSRKFWEQILRINVADEISHIGTVGRGLCIGGQFDWVLAPAHALKNKEALTAKGISASARVVSDADHFLAVTKSTEQSIRRLVSGNVNDLRTNEQYIKQVLDWVLH